MNSGKIENFWRNRAARVARQLNAAWWLECFNRLLIGGFFVLAVVILIARTEAVPWLSPRYLWFSLTVLIISFAFIAWFWAKSRFVALKAGFVRLDMKLALSGRLVSAEAGIGAWPAPLDNDSGPTVRRAAFRWDALRSCGPLCMAILFLAIAWWIPVGHSVSAARAVAAPAAWDQMEEWIAELKEENLVDSEAIQEFAKKVEDLRSQPEQDWFSHSSMEATDTLRESLAEEIRDLVSGMSDMERNLAAMQNAGESSDASEKEGAEKNFEKSLGELKENSLASKKSMLDRLQKLDPKDLSKSGNSMSAAEAKALQEQLGQAASALGAMEGLPELSKGSMPGQGGIPGQGENPGEGEFSQTPGVGDPTRGPGSAPLTLGEKETHLNTGAIAPVQSDDLSRATLGDKIGEAGESKREVEETPFSPTQGGAAATGTGGQTIRQEKLLPDEQKLLKRWFQ